MLNSISLGAGRVQSISGAGVSNQSASCDANRVLEELKKKTEEFEKKIERSGRLGFGPVGPLKLNALTDKEVLKQLEKSSGDMSPEFKILSKGNQAIKDFTIGGNMNLYCEEDEKAVKVMGKEIASIFKKAGFKAIYCIDSCADYADGTGVMLLGVDSKNQAVGFDMVDAD